MGHSDPSGITPQRRDARRSSPGRSAPRGENRPDAARPTHGGEEESGEEASGRVADAAADEGQPNGPAASKGGAVRTGSFQNTHRTPVKSSPVRQSDRHVEWVRRAVAQYERPLTQYASHLLGGDLDRARDLVQEAFLRLCDQEQDAIEGHLVEWLYTVCRNLSIDVRRKERRMRLITDEQHDSFTATYESPTDAAERVDAYGRVSEVIQSLPARQQEIVRLKFQHGMSYKEIGKVLNLTATNVGFILHTAIKSLREHLDSDLTRNAD